MIRLRGCGKSIPPPESPPSSAATVPILFLKPSLRAKLPRKTCFGYIGAILIDPAGNIYIALYTTGSVYRIDAVTGLITAVAGNGTAAFPAKGVPGVAANAQLGQLQGMAMDSKGNL